MIMTSASWYAHLELLFRAQREVGLCPYCYWERTLQLVHQWSCSSRYYLICQTAADGWGGHCLELDRMRRIVVYLYSDNAALKFVM